MLRRFGTWAALSAAVLVTPLFAQRPETRPIDGTVTHAEDGAPVAGAAVVVLDDGGRTGAVTGPAGTFRLEVPRRELRLVATRIGFAPETLAVATTDSIVRFRLRPAPVELVPVLVATERAYSAASSRTIREIDVRLRPRQSSQELLRLAPGLVIAQHAGGGKAEQIFLRGFDADHGTDVAVSVDGLPVNMVSHAHGQGYADLHFLIPELVERIDVRKGPFDVRDGDFATAGSVEFRTRDRVPSAQATVRAGSFNTLHLVAMNPLGGGAGEPGGYVAAAWHYSDGPFESAQHHRRLNLFAKWTAPAGLGREWFALGSAFAAEWDASGQIPERAVRSGAITRFGAIDPTEGGRTARADVSVGVRSLPGMDAQWEAQAFLTRYEFDLFSNFTFFLADPLHGDGIEQVDDRWLAGLRLAYSRSNQPFGLDGRWHVGAGARADRMDVALHHQERRRRLGTRVDARIAQEHLFAWAEEDLRLARRVRLNLGLRGDLFRFEVDDRLLGLPSDLPHASGTEWKGIVNPKANLAVDASDGLTLFLNAAGGFHSNDARDVILAGEGDNVLPRAWSAELGARTSWSRGTLAASAWRLDLESELVYVGDEGVTEPSGRTRRYGVDLEARLRLLPWLWADADLNLARGRFVDEPSGADRIPLAPEVTGTAGLTVQDAGPVSGGIRVRHVGSRPADETNTVRARGYTLWEAFGSWRLGRLELTVAVDNLFDAEWNEAQFATTSRLRDEPEEVTELHFTPGAPRSVEVGLSYRF